MIFSLGFNVFVPVLLSLFVVINIPSIPDTSTLFISELVALIVIGFEQLMKLSY